MFGISGFELFLILLFGFLIFGPDKLPAMAKTLGKAISKFKSAQEEMNKVIKTEVYDPSSDEPFKNPLEALSKVGESDAKKSDKDEKTESFSERKARYDKERAAKKAAEEKGAAATTAAATTAAAAAKPATGQATAGTGSGSVPKPKPAPQHKPAAQGASPSKSEAKPKPTPTPKSKPTPDELYGTKPRAKKPAPAKSAPTAAGESPASDKGGRGTTAPTTEAPAAPGETERKGE